MGSAAPRPAGVAARPAVILEAIWLWNTAPRAAMPVAMPTWRKVLLAPEAMPLRWGGTTATAEDASTGLTVPMPTPADDEARQQHRPRGVAVGEGHEEAADGDEQHARAQQVPGVDPHGQAPGERGHGEGQHRDGQEAEAGRNGP